MKTKHTRVLKILLGIFAAVALGFLVIVPRITAAREAARRNHCLSCMRSLGKVCWMYALDHNGAFPSKWSEITIYSANPTIFNCKSTSQPPSTIETVDQWAEFVLVPGLSTNHPGDTVLAYEPLSNHGGHGGNVVFCDASFRWLNSQEHRRMQETIKERHQPKDPLYFSNRDDLKKQ